MGKPTTTRPLRRRPVFGEIGTTLGFGVGGVPGLETHASYGEIRLAGFVHLFWDQWRNFALNVYHAGPRDEWIPIRSFALLARLSYGPGGFHGVAARFIMLYGLPRLGWPRHCWWLRWRRSTPGCWLTRREAPPRQQRCRSPPVQQVCYLSGWQKGYHISILYCRGDGIFR